VEKWLAQIHCLTLLAQPWGLAWGGKEHRAGFSKGGEDLRGKLIVDGKFHFRNLGSCEVGANVVAWDERTCRYIARHVRLHSVSRREVRLTA